MCSDAKTSSSVYLNVRRVRSAEDAMRGIMFVSSLDEMQLGVGRSGKSRTVVSNVVRGAVV